MVLCSNIQKRRPSLSRLMGKWWSPFVLWNVQLARQIWWPKSQMKKRSEKCISRRNTWSPYFVCSLPPKVGCSWVRAYSMTNSSNSAAAHRCCFLSFSACEHTLCPDINRSPKQRSWWPSRRSRTSKTGSWPQWSTKQNSMTYWCWARWCAHIYFFGRESTLASALEFLRKFHLLR